MLSDLGTFYATRFMLDIGRFHSELSEIESQGDPWVYYNPRKPGYNRWGLSLTSLDGSVLGRPDLDSLREYNKETGTQFDEMSFRTLTPYWKTFESISEPLEELEPHLGRSHILRLGECGAFPPHRDLGYSFRLISFLSGDPSCFYLIVDNRKISYMPGKVYFMDTKKEHALFSFVKDAYVLVLNVDLTPETIKLIYHNIESN